jgi:hypothetical protein
MAATRETGLVPARRPREDVAVTQDSSSKDGETIRYRSPRAPLPPRDQRRTAAMSKMSHEELVDALRAIDGLTDLGQGPPNFHFRSRPFLHFHDHPDGIYADVRLGRGDFQPVWASTPGERLELLALVLDHVEHVNRSTKRDRDRSNRNRRRR